MRPWLALIFAICLAGCAAIEPTKKWQNGATLKVCFTESAPAAIRQRIAAAAGEWTRWANLHFAFAPGDGRCDAHTQYDITIGFAGAGSASQVGTDSRRALPPSMTLGGLNDPTGAVARNPAEFNRIVMHEFGHAIGLEHEFQRPDARCSDRIDWTKAKAAYAKHMGWTGAQVDSNLATIDEDWQLSLIHISEPTRLM
jgi:serralysin